jgi:hypothetical protein
VYSLGCVLYECLCGEPPFVRASGAALLFAHLEDQAPAPPGLEEVMRRALAKQPGDRYGSCRELVDAAREALGVGAGRRLRRPLEAAAGAVAVAVLAVVLAVLLTSGGTTSTAVSRGRLFRIDPRTDAVSATVSVGKGPVAVAVGSGRVWVASYVDSNLTQIDPTSREPSMVPAVGRPTGMTVYGGSVDVAADGPTQLGGTVTEYDAVGGGREGGVPLPRTCSLTSGAFGVWVAGCPNVQQLTSQAGTPSVVRTVKIPYAERLSAVDYRESLAGMAQGGGAVWVIGDAADQRLWRIDPLRGRITRTIALGFPPGGLAFGDGSVWVTDQLRDRLVRIDPRSGRVLGAVTVGRGAAGVAFGGGSAWVADTIEHAVTRVDPATMHVVATIPVPAAVVAVAVGLGGVWAAGDAR